MIEDLKRQDLKPHLYFKYHLAPGWWSLPNGALIPSALGPLGKIPFGHPPHDQAQTGRCIQTLGSKACRPYHSPALPQMAIQRKIESIDRQPLLSNARHLLLIGD